MRNRETIYDLISDYLDIDGQNINVMEARIDSITQHEYFECSRRHDNEIHDDELITKKELIFDDTVSTEEKKILLVQLASLNHIEAYRTIEKYLQEPDICLYQWACLALLENKMLLEGDLLEEDRVLITSGLGAKGNKLRYFIVFFTQNGSAITAVQKRIIKNELDYAFSQQQAEMENLTFQDGIATFTAMVPLQTPVQEFFQNIVHECNEFGGFLFNDYIITNLKVLSLDEIYDVLAENNIL